MQCFMIDEKKEEKQLVMSKFMFCAMKMLSLYSLLIHDKIFKASM